MNTCFCTHRHTCVCACQIKREHIGSKEYQPKEEEEREQVKRNVNKECPTISIDKCVHNECLSHWKNFLPNKFRQRCRLNFISENGQSSNDMKTYGHCL